jgi:hypothetical protein
MGASRCAGPNAGELHCARAALPRRHESRAALLPKVKRRACCRVLSTGCCAGVGIQTPGRPTERSARGTHVARAAAPRRSRDPGTPACGAGPALPRHRASPPMLHARAARLTHVLVAALCATEHCVHVLVVTRAAARKDIIGCAFDRVIVVVARVEGCALQTRGPAPRSRARRRRAWCNATALRGRVWAIAVNEALQCRGADP